MHDPMTVAFEIRRPWPRRSDYGKSSPRWSFRGPFWQIAGRRYYWPSLITIWHVEPGGHDSGDVCKRYTRTQDPDTGKWTTTHLRGWRWHVHHWRIQVQPLQALRRTLLTRCAWCHGRSTKTDPVNTSHQWDAPRGRWWQGESGLFHGDCSLIEHAHRMCLCDVPDIEPQRHGRCARCSRFAAWRTDPARREQAALLTAVRPGERASAALLAEHRAWDAAIRATTRNE